MEPVVNDAKVTPRVGEVVEVKSAAEILATLNERGTLAALPFMPEMLKFAGQRFVVDSTADKICDTVTYSGSRRVADAVLLENLRCDGAAHDGCQAECRLFWKTDWLRRVQPGTAVSSSGAEQGETAPLEELLSRNTKEPAPEGQDRYRCQATELYKASTHLSVWDPRAYLRPLFFGNVTLSRFIRVMARALYHEPRRRLGLANDMAFPKNPLASKTKAQPLGLRPGDRVRIKSRSEIARTLNAKGQNRGLWFDREMLPFCGGTFQVRRRLTHFINDQNGEMIRLQSDCLTLDGVVCGGDYSSRRWFCPRAIYPYWRESWLERELAPAGAAIAPAGTVMKERAG